ncbi:uncharacterized protein LOC101207070 [Cucumis sativus]|uniref:Uncharacterized protein n=1 Tax=Cucumis sativus TaxID=3659 RepID=A0A0A0KWJ7_CUCSA|nr:uncharacterized protein LOC101207070 [Cucumis sativus]XP_011655817.1 uncharacterized protein LOC101207070 [Cucumis sativus]XP_011655818.1 uncharacterized protein LOC101207070 [Cucumis sativus]KGN52146.1 hypothetical protein Csa_007949 [Cucumis sativus]
MAMTAFKSSSRRGGSTSSTSSSSIGASTSGKDSKQSGNSPKKSTIRRSRSVSAFSRSSTADVSGDFSNSRDNPLFWSNGSSSLEEARAVNLESDGSSTRISVGGPKRVSSGGVENTRGRSVSRSSDSGSIASGSRKIGGRSLSRVGTERRERSASVTRYPVSSQSFNSESEAERDSRYSTKFNNRKTPDSVLHARRESGLVRTRSSSSNALQQTKGLRDRSTHRSSFDSSDNCDVSVSCSFEDRLSTASSLSEAEEKTIRAVCEQMMSINGDRLQGHSSGGDIYDIIQYEVRRAVQDIHSDLLNAPQSSSDATGNPDIDIPPELVDLRTEYMKKLEQSHERAKKLRGDLAVEENRGLELSRILREVIPSPKTSMRRKASIERRRMSKRLTDDALAYFDECVSLSTFDGSDFSSLEETPPIHQVSSTTQVEDGTTPQEPAIGTSAEIEQYNLGHTSYKNSNLSKLGEGKAQFSFTKKPHESYGFKHDIGKYIQKEDTTESRVVSVKHCNILNDKSLKNGTERVLLDRVVLRNRIESGSLLLCGVNSAPFSSYYASII